MPGARPPPPDFCPDDRAALERAVILLERTSLASRIAEAAGKPINQAMAMLPRFVTEWIHKVVEKTVLTALNLAISSIDLASIKPPRKQTSTMVAGIAGGVGGLFGIAALPAELPFTTTLMLRAIADVARHEGEDLSQIEVRLACLEVFALSSEPGASRIDFGYYAARAILTKMSAETAALVLERGLAGLTAPVVHSFVMTIVNRFSAVVTERVAASAVPLVGAVGGATINVVFMNHFQSLAQGHFTMRRLERTYGEEPVREAYLALAATANAPRPASIKRR